MSVDSSRETLTEYLLALLYGGAYTRYLAPDVALTIVGTDQRARGRQAVGRILAHLYPEAFDGTHELRQLVCEGGRAALEARVTGGDVAERVGISPTGGEVGVPYVGMYRLGHDLIEEIRLYFPTMPASPVSSAGVPDLRVGMTVVESDGARPGEVEP